MLKYFASFRKGSNLKGKHKHLFPGGRWGGIGGSVCVCGGGGGEGRLRRKSTLKGKNLLLRRLGVKVGGQIISFERK